jgi:hypothetical protein
MRQRLHFQSAHDDGRQWLPLLTIAFMSLALALAFFAFAIASACMGAGAFAAAERPCGNHNRTVKPVVVDF